MSLILSNYQAPVNSMFPEYEFLRDPEPVAAVGHPADDNGPEPDWDALADEAAMAAAWDLACDMGHLPC